MRVKELLVVIAVVAIAAGLFAAPPAPLKPASTPAPKKTAMRWLVHGVSPAEPFLSLVQRFGKPLEDKEDDISRFTVFATPMGELRRVHYFGENTVSLSGTELGLVGEGEVKEGMKFADLAFLGKPMFSRQTDDHVSYQFDGAEIFTRDGVIFGVVGQVQLPKGSRPTPK